DRFMNKPNTKIVILTLTNSCNLSCVYCYEHNKENKVMDTDLALRIVDHEMSVEDGSDFVCVYYFGGEPFLAFDTMRKIHSHLKENTWKKGWFGFTTTNGTLVHGEAAQWLHENQESMEVYLSLDGNRRMHNANRCGSYDQIDIDFFRREYPFAKMTVTEKTLPDLAEGVICLHEAGFRVSSNPGYGVTWNEDSPDILAEQLGVLIDYYMEHPELEPATLLDQAIQDLNPYAETPKRFCGVGPMMKSYDCDGLCYPCHAFAPLCIGKKKAEQAARLDFSCPLKKADLDEKCRECPVSGNCPTCYGINFNLYDNVYHVGEEHCRMMKVLFLANAFFKYRQYRAGRLALDRDAELKLLRNIKACQKLAEA
ncbi:MAG: 4Fe-4S cluster-binding domain-containing protein, partial [Eubacteriales bacterium]|nr:4Fe-4S cluster-binding domain-containing protein [Eubacteriales bacterium]